MQKEQIFANWYRLDSHEFLVASLGLRKGTVVQVAQTFFLLWMQQYQKAIDYYWPGRVLKCLLY